MRAKTEPNILYEDEQLLVCYKPSGMATQSSNLRQVDLVSWIKNYRVKKGEPSYAGLISRLDQPVEGLLVVAKDKETAAKLTEQMQKGWKKEYCAVVVGMPKQRKAKLIHYLKKSKNDNTSQVVDKDCEGAKRASLTYKVIQYDNVYNIALIQVQLQTGRHHQIRVQMAEDGTPIYGVQKYGGCDAKRDVPLALCANNIQFRHPKSKDTMSFHIEPTGRGFQNFITLDEK